MERGGSLQPPDDVPVTHGELRGILWAIQAPGTIDELEVIREFLAGVDPDRIEKRAMDLVGGLDGGELTMGRSFMAALWEMAGGRAT